MRTEPPLDIASLLEDQRAIGVDPSGAIDSSSPSDGLIFPGAFNPLHHGHREMAGVAESIVGRRISFEISLINVDKPRLETEQAARRSEQFTGWRTVWFTRAATFREKADIFGGAVFVVGADTMARIADEKYSEDRRALLNSIGEIAARGCRFLVFGRRTVGRFLALSDLDLPDPLRDLCEEVPETTFRRDASSSELRGD